MRILFVCHRLPFPPNRGGKIRPFNMIRHLHQKHEVVVASLAESQDEREAGRELDKYCAEVLVEVVPKSVRWRQAISSVASSEPSSVAYFRSSKLHDRVKQRLTRERFDLVLVHCAFVAQYVHDWRGGVKLLDFGDLDSEKWAEYASHHSLPLSIGYALEAWKLRRYEQWLATQFHHCTFTTRGERDAFEKHGGKTGCSIIPNGVDTAYFAPDPHRRTDKHVILFLGRMDYFPNIDGIKYFVKEIFPLIRAQRPGAQLRIVGSNPHADVARLGRIDGITVTGHVADVRPHAADAAVAVAPLRLARGTQNKILECLAMGVPVVATTAAAKGVQAVPGRDLIVTDCPETFAHRVIQIMEDEELRNRLVSSGREQVKAAHSWATSMESLQRLLDELALGKSDR